MALVSSAAKEYTCDGRGGAQRPLPGSPLCGASPGGRAIQRALGGRLLLFFSDFRVPHEVLPVRRGERFAATCWYLSGERAVGTSSY